MLRNLVLLTIFLGLSGSAIWLVLDEIETSHLQAHFLASLATDLNTVTVRRSSGRIRFPIEGPYDRRLGYVQLPDFVRRLADRNYEVRLQAQISEAHARAIDWGFFPIYREKSQGGVSIYGASGDLLYAQKFPQRVFRNFDDIPSVIVDALLFIEDKHLLNKATPFHNPAVEWDRFLGAIIDVGLSKLDPDYDVQGGSTLATQLEKFRHSREGRTQGVRDKLLQMGSAMLRAYQGGASNWSAREQVVLNYINSVPLAAIRGFGEVNGLGDGLWAYYGVDFERLKSVLRRSFKELSQEERLEYAAFYRRVLSLFLAHRRPSEYLKRNPEILERQVQRYLPLLVKAGLIDGELAALARENRKDFRTSLETPVQQFAGMKTTYTLRSQLMGLLGVPSLYELDRLDLRAISTLYSDVQEGVVEKLAALKDAAVAKKHGLYGGYLFEPSNDLSKVVTSVTIYEKTPAGNMLRVQADNYDQPLNISEGVKLDLGSTSKLRTLITYLQIIEAIYNNYKNESLDTLKSLKVADQDPLSAWVLTHLLQHKNSVSLPEILEAAMDRRYSANPGERFFTAGGMHTFHNFNNRFNGSLVTVKDSLRHSINLPFIRMMRDIVRYYSRFVGASGFSASVIRDLDGATRERYLRKFADREGRKFMDGFYKRYESKSKQEILLELQRGTALVDKRFAAFVWELGRNETFEQFFNLITAEFDDYAVTEEVARKLYETLRPYAASLSDRSYIARIHPLELWVAAYLYNHPEANYKQVLRAGREARQAAYRWLFVTKHRGAQDSRIRIIVESEAFQIIHNEWKKLGYPHSFLVPSYASALGVSADTPNALAKLIGILVNDGISMPYYKMSQLHFGVDTPFETLMNIKPNSGLRVLSSEIASVVRTALRDVVKNGTAVRISKGLSDGEQQYELGGKTGTGDHRHMVYRGGRAVVAEVRNRSANFVFFIDDLLFGTVTVFVPGKDAADYSFTSSLAVQILKYLEPTLQPLLLRVRRDALISQAEKAAIS